jgi:alkylation response protein AidB-like acyl-CoA dehydrogenase
MRWRIEDTPEMAAFRQEFKNWLASVLPEGWMEAIDQGDEETYASIRKKNPVNPIQWMRTIGESGYAAPLWPKEYGGLSGEAWMQRIVREELSHYRLPLFGPNLLGLGLAGPTIIEHGTEQQKQRYLKKILTGEEIWCQLFSEPGAGSDLASLSTRAVRDGDEWVVNGQKVWTSIAQFAHFGMLLARTNPDVPKHDGLTYFIVDMKSPGIEVRPLKQMTGSSEFNEVYFTDVRIPHENIVGGEGKGWICARTTLMWERITLSGISLDAASLTGGTRKDPWQSLLDGLPDTKDPLTRQQLARIFSEQEVKEATAFRAQLARAGGKQAGPEGSFAKFFNAEFNQRKTNFAVTAAGMAGVAWSPDDREAESRAHAFLRARANTIEGGTSEILRNVVGERVLGLPREPEVDKGIPWKDIKRSG